MSDGYGWRRGAAQDAKCLTLRARRKIGNVERSGPRLRANGGTKSELGVESDGLPEAFSVGG